MKLFEITASGSPPTSVFAESYDEAVSIYMVYWMSHENGELPDIELRQRNALWPGLNTEFLAKALSLEISGMGYLNPDVGWEILPPNHGIEGAAQ